jgi:hypothetical protein
MPSTDARANIGPDAGVKKAEFMVMQHPTGHRVELQRGVAIND